MNVEGFWEVRVPAKHMADILCSVLMTDEKVPSLFNTGELGSGTESVNVDCRQVPCGGTWDGTWDGGKCEKGLWGSCCRCLKGALRLSRDHMGE